MGLSKTYEDVSRARLSCMKSRARARVQSFASAHHYQIAKWEVPDGDHGRCHVVLRSVNGKKPDLDFVVQFNRNGERLKIEVIRMPAFISSSRAIKQVDQVYQSCG